MPLQYNLVKIQTLDMFFESSKVMKHLNNVNCDIPKFKLLKPVFLNVIELHKFISTHLDNITEECREPLLKLVNNFITSVNNFCNWANEENENKYHILDNITKFNQETLDLTFSKVASWILMANYFYYFLTTNIKRNIMPKDLTQKFIDYIDDESLDPQLYEDFYTHHNTILLSVYYLFKDYIMIFKTHDFDKIMGECCVCYETAYINKLPCHKTHLICNSCIKNIKSGSEGKLKCPLCKEICFCINKYQGPENETILPNKNTTNIVV